jgi:DNA-binding NarL/FixJ family response regulator
MEQAALIRILIVDDHQLVRDGLRARLGAIARFLVVAEAETSQGALAETQKQEIDLVLMDINLKGASGIEAAAQFHELHPGVAVIMLSMHDKAEYVLQSIQAGARGYVLKDAPASDIISAIDTAMAGGVFYSEALKHRLAAPLPKVTLLTPREKEILQRIADGHSNKQIARELDLSVRTVETHRWNIKRKLNIDGQADLVRFAVENALDR